MRSDGKKEKGQRENFPAEGRVLFGHDLNDKKLKVARREVLKRLQRLFANNPVFSHRVKKVELSLRNITKKNAGIRLPLIEVTARLSLFTANRQLVIKEKGRRLGRIVGRILRRTRRLLRREYQPAADGLDKNLKSKAKGLK